MESDDIRISLRRSEDEVLLSPEYQAELHQFDNLLKEASVAVQAEVLLQFGASVGAISRNVDPALIGDFLVKHSEEIAGGLGKILLLAITKWVSREGEDSPKSEKKAKGGRWVELKAYGIEAKAQTPEEAAEAINRILDQGRAQIRARPPRKTVHHD